MCYCGTETPFELCCKVIIQQQSAETPEQLMRSRYSAFACHSFDYIIDTHHPSTLDTLTKQDLEESAEATQWLCLKVINTSPIQALSPQEYFAEVEFVATYQSNGSFYNLHEHSYFETILGKWFYKSGKEGKLSGLYKPERNELCPCQSKKKYKKCCYV
ncbi:SEC-C domain-containing protein [Glaciecola sp. MH2013]|uniref:YchJ family protein n=1 Tax=Glaciecola sp. MH2013 TaxID=2785524 RepID=UPI00189C9FEF|nr:YchJ family metal-binding protein [Glaciecola sp. MH2013]MBF7072569.1 SEC-C domain-containing protein [Glaciecola sp. MH2013]